MYRVALVFLALAPLCAEAQEDADQEKIVKQVRENIGDVVAGAGGRYLFLRLVSVPKVAVFDVAEQDIIEMLPVPKDALIAAGADRFIAVSPLQHAIYRWSFADFSEPRPARLPMVGIVANVALGHSAKGPLLVYWRSAHRGSGLCKYTLHDLDSLAPIGLAAIRQIHMGTNRAFPLKKPFEVPLWSNHFRERTHFRASGSGLAFGIWCTKHTASGLQTLLLHGRQATNVYENDSAGFVIPNDDCSLVYTAAGCYMPDLSNRRREEEMCIPSYLPRYYLSVSLKDQKHGEVIDTMTEKPVLEFHDLEETGDPKKDQWAETDFTLDKRYHLAPQYGLLITIPATDDRLVLRKLGPGLDIPAQVAEGDVAIEVNKLPPALKPDRPDPKKPQRTWTDKSGKFRIVARFVSMRAGKVKLEKKDGGVITVDVEVLCQADRDYLNGLRK